MRYLAFILGLAVAVCAAAQEDAADGTKYFPQQLTAQELLYACASSSLTRVGRERKKFCAGFVSGVEEAVRLLETTRGPQGVARICAPVGATAANFADAYIKYASQRTDLSRPAAAVVADALKSAYPCVK
jgi:hypothetical protein